MNDPDYLMPHKSLTVRWLAERLGVKDLHAELKKAMTHKSFYKEGDEQKSNSRYIFIGMYGFKGKVAELVFNFVSGTGTQLQHYLGNIFKDDILLKIFDRYRLGPLCRYGPAFDIQKQKHVMIYGFLGFIYAHVETEKLEQFIMQNFIDGSFHLVPGQNHNRDLLSQCSYFARLRYNKKPVLQIQKLENGIFCTSVLVGEEIISNAESISYKYSRKKAIKQAVLFLSAPLRFDLENDPIHQTIEEELEKAEADKKMAQKEEKQKRYLERQAKRAEIRATKKEEKKKDAKERELARRKAKAKAKSRAETKAKAAAEKDAAMQNISVAKRRHIQDKQK